MYIIDSFLFHSLSIYLFHFCRFRSSRSIHCKLTILLQLLLINLLLIRFERHYMVFSQLYFELFFFFFLSCSQSAQHNVPCVYVSKKSYMPSHLMWYNVKSHAIKTCDSQLIDSYCMLVKFMYIVQQYLIVIQYNVRSPRTQCRMI